MPEPDTFEAVASEAMTRCAQLREAILRERGYATGEETATAKRTNEMGKLTAEVIKLVRNAAALVRENDTAEENRLREVRSAIAETLQTVRTSMESLGEAKNDILRNLTMQDRRTHAIRAYTAIGPITSRKTS